MRGMRQGPMPSYISDATRHFIEGDVYACMRRVAFAIASELTTVGGYLAGVVLRAIPVKPAVRMPFPTFFKAFSASFVTFEGKCISHSFYDRSVMSGNYRSILTTHVSS